MSVEKFTLSHEETGFTNLPNKVLQGLRNAEALGVWSYFASLPPQWVFYKDSIREHFVIGRDKLEKLLQILQLTNLITITQTRKDLGRYGDWILHVRNGKDFVQISHTSPLTDFQGTVRAPVNIDVSPFTCLPFTANQSLVNSSYKETNTKALKNINKTKSFLNKKSGSKSDSPCVQPKEGFKLADRAKEPSALVKDFMKKKGIKEK